MKRLILLPLAFLLCSIPAAAQKIDASIGYSYFHIGGSGSVNQNGISGSLAYNANRFLGIVGDFGGYHASPSGVSLTTYTYMFGPRLTARNPTKINPFVQGLVGGSHVTAGFAGATSSSNPFAYSFGGGVDLGFFPMMSLRPQVDYVGLRQSGATTNCTRVSISLVLHL